MKQFAKNAETFPQLLVSATVGRSFLRDYDFVDEETKERKQGTRRFANISFVDANGVPTIGSVTPVFGFALDFSQFERKTCNLFVSRFELDKSGVCQFRLVGIDDELPVKPSKN